jgi:hypothetical protein
MRGVFSRRLFAVLALVVLLAAPSAIADSGSADPGVWAQFVVWVEARIGIPNGATTADEISFEDWLVLMARIGIPN